MADIATGNREEALDIVQDSMLKLCTRYGDRPELEWGALFHVILQSRIRDWYRRSRVRNRWQVWFKGDGLDEAEDPIARQPDPGPGIERQLEHVAMVDELEVALRALPLRQQQCFLLRVWEGLSVAEAARAMACSEGSVKTHYHRAIHKLRTSLEGYAP